MLDKIDKSTDIRPWCGNIPIHHRYTLGVAGERFFKAMRDQKQILAARCPSCGDTFLLPMIYCEGCFEETQEWSPVQGPGYVKTYTILHRSLDEDPLGHPIVAALIAWEGVRGGLIHKLDGIEPQDVEIGLAVEPKWAKERTGSLEDIRFFRPTA